MAAGTGLVGAWVDALGDGLVDGLGAEVTGLRAISEDETGSLILDRPTPPAEVTATTAKVLAKAVVTRRLESRPLDHPVAKNIFKFQSMLPPAGPPGGGSMSLKRRIQSDHVGPEHQSRSS
jgi:hypothetical protein